MSAPGIEATDTEPPSWAAATWTVPLMPAVISLLWLGIGPTTGGMVRYTGVVAIGTALALLALPALRWGRSRLRGIGLGALIGAALTALLAAVLSLR